MDEDLTALDLRVVTVTEDEHGIVQINHAGMDEARALWLLESAKHLILNGYWFSDDEDEGDNDE